MVDDNISSGMWAGIGVLFLVILGLLAVEWNPPPICRPGETAVQRDGWVCATFRKP